MGAILRDRLASSACDKGARMSILRSEDVRVCDGSDVRRAPERARRTRASACTLLVRVLLACSACNKGASVRVTITTGVSVRDRAEVWRARDRALRTRAGHSCSYPSTKTELVSFLTVRSERDMSRALSK